MRILQTQILNVPFSYINGFQISYLSAHQWSVAPGRCRNNTNTADIVMPNTQVIDFNLQGIGGMDIVSALTASTFYYCYAIADSSGKNPSGCLVSLNKAQPILPSGYDMYYFIGGSATDSTSALFNFYSTGNGLDRQFWYANGNTILNNGTASTFTQVTCAVLPAIENVIADIAIGFTPVAAGNVCVFRKHGSSSGSALGDYRTSGVVAGITFNTRVFVPCDATPSIDYLVNGSGSTLTLSLSGYRISLGT